MLYTLTWASLVAQRLKRLPGMQETWVRSLGQEDPLEKEIAVLLPGESHGGRSLVGYSPWGRKESDTMSDFTSYPDLYTAVCQLYLNKTARKKKIEVSRPIHTPLQSCTQKSPFLVICS